MRAGTASGGMPRQRGPPGSMLRGDTRKVCAFAQNGRHRAHCIRRVHMRLQTGWTPECSPSACVSEPDRSSGAGAGTADNGTSLIPLGLRMNWGELLARPRRLWRTTRGPPGSEADPGIWSDRRSRRRRRRSLPVCVPVQQSVPHRPEHKSLHRPDVELLLNAIDRVPDGHRLDPPGFRNLGVGHASSESR